MNAENVSQPPAHDDHEWQCLRYVLGEMSTAEAGKFEELLAGDQEARERVASCVALVGGAYSALASRPDAPRIATAASRDDRRLAVSASSRNDRLLRHLGRWVLAAVSVAVCVAVTAGLYVLTLRGPARFERPYAHESLDSGAESLASIWSAWLSESTLDPDGPEFSPADRPERAAPDDADEELAQDTDDRFSEAPGEPDQAAKDFQVPRWLIAAVSTDEARESNMAAPELREN